MKELVITLACLWLAGGSGWAAYIRGRKHLGNAGLFLVFCGFTATALYERVSDEPPTVNRQQSTVDDLPPTVAMVSHQWPRTPSTVVYSGIKPETYHAPECRYAKMIKSEHRIEASEETAKATGRTPCKHCH